MRAVVQRVTRARVEVEGQVVGEIGPGLVCFLGIGKGDTQDDLARLVDKVTRCRIFEDENGKMARSLGDVSGGLLVVSQFTLYGDTSRGRRPSFEAAMPPDTAERMYLEFVERARLQVAHLATGQFRANMAVIVENDGPVTILFDSK